MQFGTSPAETPVPFARARANRAITRAWEAFLSSGEVGGAELRPLIADGWRRSRELGIDPLLQRAPSVLSPEELRELLAREDLGRAGKAVLEDFGRVVEGTGGVIVLADAQGRILYAVGHRDVQATLERVNLAPGGLWSEAAAGPNGIGTPIALGRPEMVFGPEHYCQGWQPFFCCGSPVRDPATGRILGAVDITSPASKAHPMAFALTLSITRWVERNLTILGLERRDAMLRSFRDFERRRPGDAIALLDAESRVMDLNSAAAGALGLAAAAPNAETTPALASLARRAYQTGTCQEGPLTLRRPGAGSCSYVCRVEPVYVDARAVGSVVVLSARSGRAARASHLRPVEPRADSSPGRAGYSFSDILGGSPALQEALRLARAVARGPQLKPVLILGESGTGKEVVAHAIHGASGRAQGGFVAVNCSALPRELVESELFGYASGAFTGARREGQAGKFEAAQGGTVFLDEVDSMPIEVQAKLLRVIETGEVVRLGSAHPVRLDVAVIAASGPDLRRQTEQGQFRLDLFHRLSVVEILMPPLRERREDILELAQAFLDRECRRAGRVAFAIAPEAARRLVAYHWPGNIRELENLCARWVVTADGAEIGLRDLPAHVRGGGAPAGHEAGSSQSLRCKEDSIIRQTLIETGGRVAEAARRLAINKTTIYRRMKRWPSEQVAACNPGG